LAVHGSGGTGGHDQILKVFHAYCSLKKSHFYHVLKIKKKYHNRFMVYSLEFDQNTKNLILTSLLPKTLGNKCDDKSRI
jgi:hypothetical protein